MVSLLKYNWVKSVAGTGEVNLKISPLLHGIVYLATFKNKRCLSTCHLGASRVKYGAGFIKMRT